MRLLAAIFLSLSILSWGASAYAIEMPEVDLK